MQSNPSYWQGPDPSKIVGHFIYHTQTFQIEHFQICSLDS